MITLNIATHKARETSLKIVLPAVLKQRTKAKVNIYLNDYDCPDWLKKLPVNVVEHTDGDLGAAAKFYFTQFQNEGVYITLDDDLIPNEGYVGYLADMAYRYPNSIVGLHGTTYKQHPVKSYYSDTSKHVDYCYQELTENKTVDMLGTGAMAFRVNMKAAPTLDVFEAKNSTDPFLCKHCKDNGISLICIQRTGGFVREIQSAQDVAIWRGVMANDSKQTKVINSIMNFKRHSPYRFMAERLNDGSIMWGHLKWIGAALTQQTKLVELGSGASTEYFGKMTDKIYSIEHNAKYHRSGITNLRPLKNGWYDLNSFDWQHIEQADVIVIDGPIGSTGDRYNLPIEKLPKTATIYVDDCHRPKDKEMAEKIAAYIGREIVYLQDGVKIMVKI